MIYENCENIGTYWLDFDRKLSDYDYLDFRAAIRGTILDTEMFMRKVRNFSDVYSCNLIFPWASQEVATYCSRLPEDVAFDRKALKNKVVLRSLLKDRLGLDSDALGKMVFSYDNAAIIDKNWAWVRSQIVGCALWATSGSDNFFDTLKRQSEGSKRGSIVASDLLYRLFLLSLWFNRCKYIN
jgi:asparagine synthase (glutamine-hydrolysing)